MTTPYRCVTPRGCRNAHATAFTDTPPPVSRDFAEAFLQVRLPNHGGLMLAAPDASRDDHVRRRAETPLQGRFPITRRADP